MSISLDGFVAGPNDGVDQPLGDGGAALHGWLLNGEIEFTGDLSSDHEGTFNLTGADHDVVAEWFGSTGVLTVATLDAITAWRSSTSRRRRSVP